MKKHDKLSKILYFTVLVSFIIPIIFLTVKIILMSYGILDDSRNVSDYTLMLLECILGAIVIHLPAIIEHKLKFKIPKSLFITYLVFLYCAIFLGEVRNFYYHVPHWDSILHGLSGVLSGTFGIMMIDILNRNKKVSVSLSPLFVAVFAFCFSITIGALWEIYEFSFDGLLGLNMQKFRLGGGTQLIGRNALSDTMKDIIIDSIGAFIASVIGYINLKNASKKAKTTDSKEF